MTSLGSSGLVVVAMLLILQETASQDWEQGTNDVTHGHYHRAGVTSAAREAQARDFSHQATVLIYRNPTDIRICGGSLVERRWVLSSAACLNKCADDNAQRGDGDDPNDCSDFFRVVLGAQRLQTEEASQELHTVVRVVVHPEYRGDVANDIALLQLDTPAALSEYIQPVELPPLRGGLRYQPLLLSGWGSAEDENRSNLTLRSTTVSSFPSFFGNLVCKAVFLNHRVDGTHMCGRQASCTADRGGNPLVVHEGSRVVQVALSSGATSKQCERVFPSLFLRLDSFANWIRAQTGLPLHYYADPGERNKVGVATNFV